MTTVIPYRPLSREFLAAYVTTMRPYLLFVSGVTGIAGMSLVPEVRQSVAMLIFAATFLSYGFGQALTDCFQIDTDRLSSPYRPLTQGTVRRGQVLAVSVVGLAVCVTILTVLNPWNLLLGTLAGAGLATYTPFKRRWWGGPWYNAWIVGLLGLMAFLAARGGSDLPLPPALPWTLGGIFFGYANFVLAGYLKDVTADSDTGYDTFPVVFGRTRAATASSMLATLAMILMTAARSLAGDDNRPAPVHLVSWSLLIAAIAVTVAAQVLLHRVRRDEESHAAIGLVVHGYILGLASIATGAQPGWTPFLLLFYVMFIVVLAGRPSRNQI